jgi:hypothetical protein
MPNLSAKPDDLFNMLFGEAEEMGIVAPQPEPLDGAELGIYEWIQRYYGNFTTAEWADRHKRVFDWFDAIEPNIAPRFDLVETWGRGGAKSSTVEIGTARWCAKLSRRYVLYLCGTQEQANKHVQSISTLLGSLGVERKVNKYGSSQGWRRDELRTANGFNVTGIGIREAMRGAKLDNFRPDALIIDDIDEIHDSGDVIARKIERIRGDIIGAGAPHLAIIYVQNLIHAMSIMAKVRNRTADFLMSAKVAPIEPAVQNLEVEQQEDGTYKIVSGEATWAGQPLDACERQINKQGLQSFLRESQHDMRAGGAFFPEYDPAVHLVPTPGIDDVDGNGKPIYPQSWWNWYGGLDGGYNDPAAFELWCSDPHGNEICVEAWEERHMRPIPLAQKVRDTLTRWGIDPRRCPITYDHNMGASTWKGVRTEPDVKAFTDAGLWMRASDPQLDRQAHGWNRVREFLALPGKVRYLRETAIRAADAISGARFHLTKPEDMAHDGNSHLAHAHLYATAGQYGAATPPESPEAKAARLKREYFGLIGEKKFDAENRLRGRDYL